VLITLLLACDPDPADSDPILSCDGAGAVEVIATGFAKDDVPGTEGITFSPDGRLFVGGTAQGPGYVAEVHPDGTWNEIAAVPGSVGLTWWRDRVVVAAADGVVLVDPDSAAITPLATGIEASNFPVVTPWDTLLVASPSSGRIVEVAPDGTVSPWLETLSPNGLVFDEAGEWLYVAQTYEEPNVLRRVRIEEGKAGDVEDVVTLDGVATQDGVAIDANGDVYVALNLPGKVVRVTPEGEVSDVAEVAFPASLAFGTGDWHACSLYVTSLFTADVFRVGAPAPGL
jgi:sugar lactone lactonase YvrE